MNDDRELLKKRFAELAKKSYNQGCFTFTDFLGLAEQSAFSEILREIFGIPYTVYGGADGAERVIIRFGSPDELGYEMPFPIKVLHSVPTAGAYSEKLSHRDFLGTVLGLGIDRRCVGDIVLRDGGAYIFVKDEVADFIADNLTRARHTPLSTKIVDALPEGELYKTELRRVQANGERLDALIAKLYSLSREDAQALFSKKLVFASGRCIESTSYVPKEGEVISVRGTGRFIYRGYDSLTKKGKLNINLEVYC